MSRFVGVGLLSSLFCLPACSGAGEGDDSSLASTEQSVTAAECTAQLSTCVGAARSISALFACNESYGACLVDSTRLPELPGAVLDATDALASCAADLTACVGSADRPSELVACQEENLACAGDALGVVVAVTPAAGAAACVDDAQECVQNADSISDLTACGDGLVGCTAEAAEEVVESLPLPPLVADAVSGVNDCSADLRACVRSASAPSDLIACSEAEAACLADILDVSLPDVSAAVDCTEGAVACVTTADSVSDLTACSESFAGCAIDVAVDVLPDEIEGTLDDVGACADTLLSCVGSATNPFELAACNTENAECIAGALDVPLPASPTDLVNCAEEASTCTLDATKLSEVTACAEDLTECVTAPVVPLVNCEVQFTQCTVQNPFNLFQCAEEARKCRLGF